MRLVAFGDLHAHDFAEFAEPHEKYANTRLKAIVDVLENMIDYCKQEGIEYVLFAGDLFHKRVLVDTRVKNIIYDVVAESGLQWIMIPGNHDQVDNSDYPQHSLHTFKDISGVVVLDRFASYTLLTPPGEDDVKIFPSPYSKNTAMVKDNLAGYINEIKQDKEEGADYCNILLGHAGISGATVGKSRYAMQDAFGINDFYPDVFNFGVFGHYHRRQRLDHYETFAYTGSPLQHNFNDEGQSNGFLLLDTVTGDLDFVDVLSPKFITVKTKNYDPDDLRGNYVRFQIPADEVESLAEELPEELHHRIEPQKEFKEEKRVDVDHSMSSSEVVKTYCDQFNPEATSVLLDILSEVE
ncbi:SbcD type exonuclease [Bacillus phage SP-10]|uniref:SbcD type exonuclease n=1 Tax=Bacillus phage SP10 TaxID=941058 RepID=UPI0002198B7C|nr:SbcD type exonuclease [Bacillus phage SP-10]BAK52980.1 SbcD type exonuclease [Bacillus phage SP-10]